MAPVCCIPKLGSNILQKKSWKFPPNVLASTPQARPRRRFILAMSSRLITSTAQISIFLSARRHAIIPPRWSTRNLHAPRPLPYPIDQGLGNFLPPAALKTLAVEYQEGLLERLNDQVRGKLPILHLPCASIYAKDVTCILP